MGKTCVITGAGGGIGRAAAAEIAVSGDFSSIVLIGKNRRKAQRNAIPSAYLGNGGCAAL